VASAILVELNIRLTVLVVETARLERRGVNDNCIEPSPLDSVPWFWSLKHDQAWKPKLHGNMHAVSEEACLVEVISNCCELLQGILTEGEVQYICSPHKCSLFSKTVNNVCNIEAADLN
jgi:hypothetical protein